MTVISCGGGYNKTILAGKTFRVGMMKDELRATVFQNNDLTWYGSVVETMKSAALSHGFGLYEIEYNRSRYLHDKIRRDKISCINHLNTNFLDICIGKFCFKNDCV